MTADRHIALRAALALTGSAACWGFSTVATKALLARVPPLTLVNAQLLASVLFLWGAALVTRSRLPGARIAGLAAISGLLEPGLAYTTNVLGLTLTTASTAALIGGSETPLIILLAWLFLGERMGTRALLLTAAAAAGVGIVLLPDLGSVGGGSLAGDALVLASHALAAGYVTASRTLVGGAAPLPLAALQQTAGLLWTFGALVVGRLVGSPWAAPAEVAPGLLVAAGVTGIVQYALAFWLYLTGLRHMPASRSGVFLTLMPVFGVLGAAVALGERVAPVQWLGAVVVVVAVQALVRTGTGTTEREHASATRPAAPRARAGGLEG